jgi:hypothetical protein
MPFGPETRMGAEIQAFSCLIFEVPKTPYLLI